MDIEMIAGFLYQTFSSGNEEERKQAELSLKNMATDPSFLETVLKLIEDVKYPGL